MRQRPCAVLDTNVLIAAAYAEQSASRKLVEATLAGLVKVVVSDALLCEYRLLLSRAVKSSAKLHWLWQCIEQTERVVVDQIPRVVPRDPDDDKLVALAFRGRAEVIVTNDHHLLSLDPLGEVRIFRPTESVRQLLRECG